MQESELRLAELLSPFYEAERQLRRAFLSGSHAVVAARKAVYEREKTSLLGFLSAQRVDVLRVGSEAVDHGRPPEIIDHGRPPEWVGPILGDITRIDGALSRIEKHCRHNSQPVVNAAPAQW